MCSKNKMNKPKSKYPKKLIVFAFDSKIIDAWVGGYAFPLLLTINIFQIYYIELWLSL